MYNSLGWTREDVLRVPVRNSLFLFSLLGLAWYTNPGLLRQSTFQEMAIFATSTCMLLPVTKARYWYKLTSIGPNWGSKETGIIAALSLVCNISRF